MTLTLEGKNGRIELDDTTAKIFLYKKELTNLSLKAKWDQSRIGKVYEIPREKVVKAEYTKILGQLPMVRVYFPGAGLSGNVAVYINEDQLPDAENMVKLLIPSLPPEVLKSAIVPKARPTEASHEIQSTTQVKAKEMTDELTVDEELEAFEKERRIKRMMAQKESDKITQEHGGLLMILGKAFVVVWMFAVFLQFGLLAFAGALTKHDYQAALPFFVIGWIIPWYVMIRMGKKRVVKGKEQAE